MICVSHPCAGGIGPSLAAAVYAGTVRPPPRLFGISATAADLVAVLRRGPSDWTHVGLWDVASPRFHSGSWLRATVYPQRCDVSPDGRYLCYFALNGGAQWNAGDTYIAVSRLPWVTALAAWRTEGTYTRGAYFVDDPTDWEMGQPDEGDAGRLRQRYGLVYPSGPVTFAVERRRGWTETPDSPRRADSDTWDERRVEAVRVGRPRPSQPGRRGRGDTAWLVAGGGYAAHRAMDGRWFQPPAYELRDGPGGPVRTHLDQVQWADWARDGRLLVATTDGRLQIRDGATGVVRWELDLAGLRPAPEPPPPEARHW